MKRILLSLSIAAMVGFSLNSGNAAEKPGQEYRRITVREYRDKMKAGWIGQIAGVSWGGPTEFKALEETIPMEKMPKWKPEMINDAFDQDDIYVEMTFLRTMEQYGIDVSLKQAGIDFANSEYRLWHANVIGRRNLRSGIAPPDSSHPKFSQHADDIDYQIEADFSGLIAPGLPGVAVEMGDKFGRLMNYGDGVYGGVFVGAMYCEAFFETDVVRIIRTALRAIPEDSQYAEMVRDVLRWYEEEPSDWIKTWNKIEAKYQKNPLYRRWSCDPGKFNIDVKINGAYILMGLLYGKGDLDQTIIISTRCGQDSDCNPSNAAGVLFTTLGFSKLPARFSEKLDETKVFSHTAYNFPALVNVCDKIAREAILKEGGFVEKNAQGEEVYVIPVKKITPEKAMKSWAPGPIANSKYSEEEMKQIRFKGFRSLEDSVAGLFPGWTLTDCGPDMEPGFLEHYRNRENVLLTHPKSRNVPAVLSRKVEIPAGKKTFLKLSVSHHQSGDWELIVKIDGKEKVRKTIGPDAPGRENGWFSVSIDLSEYAGKTVLIELLNQPTDWKFEGGYWSRIELE